MYKVLKKHKKLSCLFFAVLVSYLAFYTSVSAADCVYGTWDNDLVQRITVANFLRDLIRSCGYWILKGIAYLIDMVEDAINEVLSLNIYDGVKEFFNFDSWIYPMATAIFLFCLVGCAIFLMIFYNKGRMSAFFKSIIMASFLIFAFPALISALTDLKDAGVTSISAIDPSGATSNVTHSIGDSILSSITVDMELSGDYGVEKYVADSDDYSKKTDIAYNLNINATIDSDDANTPYKWAVDSSEPIAKTYKQYDELTDENILELLGVKDKCNTLTDLYDNFISSSKSNGTHDINNFYINYGQWIINEGGHNEWNYSSTRGDAIWYYICYNIYQRLCEDSSIDLTLLEGVVWKTTSDFTLTDQYTIKIETVMNDASNTVRDYKISPSPKSLITKLVSELRSTGIAKQLNTIRNTAESEKDTEYKYTYTKLYTDADLEADQDWAVDALIEIKMFLLNGFTVTQNIYAYDYDFIYGIIILVCVLICLLSAGIRLVRLLLDIVFMQIIGPIVFASDLQDSGRTKRLLTEVISSFIVIIIVLLLIKLYIIILLWTFRQDLSWITKLLIVFGGWRFTIDGPDIVVKICGIDAGIKSGQAALLGAYAAGRTAFGVGRGIGHFAKGGVVGTYHAARGAASGTYNGVKGENGKGFKDTVKDAKGYGGKAAAAATYAAGAVTSAVLKPTPGKKVSVNGAKSSKDFAKDKKQQIKNSKKEQKQQPNYNSEAIVKGRQNYYKDAAVSKPDSSSSSTSEPVDNKSENSNSTNGIDNGQKESRYNQDVVKSSDSGSVSDKVDNNNGYADGNGAQASTRYNQGAVATNHKNIGNNNTNTTTMSDSDTNASQKNKSSSENQKRKVNNSSHKPVVNRQPHINDTDLQKQRIANEYENSFNQGVEKRKLENQVNSSKKTNQTQTNKSKGADK